MKRYISEIIIVAIFFLWILLLAGCSKTQPVSETIADNAINATTGLEQSLPVECKTDAIMTQIMVIKTQIRTITNACKTEKDVIEQKKRYYQWAFYGVLGLIGLFLAKKVLK